MRLSDNDFLPGHEMHTARVAVLAIPRMRRGGTQEAARIAS
jgi:hypothetical protein